MSETYNNIVLKNAIEEFQRGNREKAYSDLKYFVNNNQKDSVAIYNLALMSQELDRVEEAKEYYNIAISENQKNWQAKFNLYLLFIKDKNYSKALLLINSVLSIKKNFQPALRDKALVLNHLSKPNEGLRYILKSIEINNKDYIAINILGLIYKNMNKFNKAIDTFQNAIGINPKYLASYNNLSSCYSLKHDFKTSEKILLSALKLDNEAYETINNLANIYSQTGRYDEAIKFYKKALKKNPSSSEILYNIGVAYFYKKDLELGEFYYKEAYKIDPKNDVLKKNYSLLLLAKQKYNEAWSFYDGRLNLSEFLFKNSTLNNVKHKLWDGQEIEKGKKILVIKEQGIGDEILFSSMYNDLIELFPNCIIETEIRLLNLFNKSFKHNNNFIEFGSISKKSKLLDKIDHIIYAGSLGKLFRKKIDNFPTKSFLKSTKLNKDLSNFLTQFDGKPKIGISWKSKALIGRGKSIKLEDLKPIISSNSFSFFNLQYYESKDEIQELKKKDSNIKIHNLENIDLYNDFDTVASFLRELDLFITVSNSTAHLAAALGVNTWIIKPMNHAVLHYWNQPTNKTPWYPDVTLYEYKNSWSTTIKKINVDLNNKFKNTI